jgi:hypothetical protein
MAVLADKKIAGAGFGNSKELVRVVYDFANDTGAVADYDVLVADSACVVHLVHASVKTAVTSGGSLVVDLGKGAGGTEMWSDKAVAALTLNSLHLATGPVYLAAAEKIVLGLEAAAATAGKVEFVFEVIKY